MIGLTDVREGAERAADAALGGAADLLRRSRRPFAGQGRALATPPAGSDLRPVIGDPGWPLVGQSLDFVTDRLGMMRDLAHRFGPVAWTSVLGEPCVMVLSPEGIEQLCVNRDKAISQDGWVYAIGPFFEGGLMLLDGQEHLQQRRIMQAAFTSERLDGYATGIDDVVSRTMDRWPPGPVRFHDAFRDLTLDVATQVFMGETLTAEEVAPLHAAFFAAVHAGTAVIRADVPGGRWQAGLRGRQTLQAFLRDRLPAARRRDGTDLFSALCHAEDEDGQVFDDEAIVSQMIFLLMAAHDTTTATTNSLVYRLAHAQGWQDRLREESDAVGRGRIDRDGLARQDSLALATKEAQRLISPVPVLVRRAVADTAIQGRHIPAGTLMMGVPLHVHNDPTYWPDPDVFEPLRHADEPVLIGERHRYAWMPFGGGVHKCIGMHFGDMEVGIAMHHLLQRFSWTVPDGYRMPISDESLPYPTDGLPIELSAR